MPSLSERRIDAWTALAAEPAVRAAERAIMTRSPAVLADTLAISTAAESRRRLARVLDLKKRAERDRRGRDAYQRAADELRIWAAGVYLAALRESDARISPPAGRRREGNPAPTVKHRNPHTEESISLRWMGPRPPFPGQRKRPLRDSTRTEPPATAAPIAALSRRRVADLQLVPDNAEEITRGGTGCVPALV